MSLPPCPQCQSSYVYQDGTLLICPECGYEWNQDELAEQEQNAQVKDANGAVLEAGDKVTFIKDLKVKGSSTVLKVGTKASIRRIFSDKKDHQLDCNIVGGSDMMITAKFVKKA
jgi:protein PhnA